MRSRSNSEPRPSPLLRDQSYLAYFRQTPRPFVNFVSGHFPSGTHTQPHHHDCIALHGCLQGPLVFCTPGAEMSLDAGVFYMISPGIDHSWRNDGPQTAATISLLLETERPGRWPRGTGVEACCRQLEARVHDLHRFATAGDHVLYHSFWLAADHLTAEQPRGELSLVAALLELLGEIKARMCDDLSPAGQAEDTAQLIRRLLLARVRDQLSVNQIAREIGTSPTSAKEKFRAAFGCGIISYFNQLKIWQAKRMLSDLSLTVEDVSDHLGFSSASYFSRAFLKQVGESPSAYRQRNGDSPA